MTDQNPNSDDQHRLIMSNLVWRFVLASNPMDFEKFKEHLAVADANKVFDGPFTGTEEIVMIMSILLGQGKYAQEGDEWKSVLERELRILDGTATDDDLFI